MNETLKGVAHIGAELAAVKADLQREMERHRKTWRQLEQVTGLLRRWMSDEARDNPHAIYVASEAALSQQDERTGYACHQCRAETPAPEPYKLYVVCQACGASTAATAAQAIATRPEQTGQKPVAMQPDCDAVAVCGCRIVQSRKLGNVIVLCASHIAQAAPSAVTAERDDLRLQVEAARSVCTESQGAILGLIAERDQLRAEVERLLGAMRQIRYASNNGPVSENNAGCIRRIEQIADAAMDAKEE